jgi:hypothetical protein
MAESQHKLLLSLLCGKLHLDEKSQQRAQNLFYGALGYLDRQRGSSPSLLGQVWNRRTDYSSCDRTSLA